MNTVTITLRNHLSELENLMVFVENFAMQCQLPRNVTFQVNCVLDELFTNIVSYAYNDTAEHFICLTLKTHGNKLIAELEDDGMAFNPVAAKNPDVSLPVEERKQGGLGIYLVKSMMDNVEYTRRENRNYLRLTKSIP